MFWISIISAIWYGVSARSFVTGNSATWALYGFVAFFCPSFLLMVLGGAAESIVRPDQPMLLLRVFTLAGIAAGVACSIILQRVLVSRQKRVDAYFDRA
ncbi:MAG: hypothetical protein ABIJ56_23195 [Pseudomonadota bacterium]